ncbi:MAG: preprotein translocase subunit YajC [Gammaproteobacteria bacterium RIFCSPLOWO2_02_FULL_47_50]|jgi:preprotein translocase subunit YajC|nr:MAG: preprotein translocase subunit YajC [Gammaproteobacteria bacterium RIFCSPLOWO2_01_FULL_47_190]OGT75295.1 MAG: preprotein translocase subunit YajC [Gammaproteobacteria bacterium RIFCSPLOWO2_12_47_11]OGT81637.1 MAG: preprotein translocase subunit YajC [Gammaproteobacteria bacterium RIFCSPLOWO2_02_FULL_47_50]OGT87493.1 MAG: preprotein translocase subunit YajC [Gammaproteobacteria bacterium RIFCSPLOWO2_12_FULL_47_76]
MLEFFIQNAWAQETPPAGSGFMSLLPLILIFVVFYFFLIRPQMKQAKEHKQMVEALAKGDEVVTSGGMLGKITKIGDSFIHVEIAPNIEVKVQKHSVSAILPKGTLKTL